VFPPLSHLVAHMLQRRLSASLAGALASLTLTGLSGVLPVASAQAASSATCPSAPLSQPFAQWGDSNSYALVPGGDFESASAAWTVSGGAQRTAGSESYGVTGSPGAWSLALPAGAAARSPFICVSAADQTFRLFARSAGPAATVLAQVVYKTPLGNVAIAVGKFVPGSSWAPTEAFQTGAALASALSSSGTVQLAVRFTSLGGSARIDDVFIDPRMHR
jgi:hypothetical protein